MHLCLRQTAFTLALQAKRSGEREGARRKATGRVRGDRMYVYCRVSHSRAELSFSGKRPLTLPMLRIGALPLPAEAGRGQSVEAE
jgi:hypothetical protein